MDIVSSITILAGLTAILGFFWNILRKKSSDDNDSNDNNKNKTKELTEKEDKLEQRLAMLEQTDADQEVEIKKLSDTCDSLRDENGRLRQDIFDNLDRLEARLEKMLDLIISNFKKDKDSEN